jgi:hypothetical protein
VEGGVAVARVPGEGLREHVGAEARAAHAEQ